MSLSNTIYKKMTLYCGYLGVYRIAHNFIFLPAENTTRLCIFNLFIFDNIKNDWSQQIYFYFCVALNF